MVHKPQAGVAPVLTLALCLMLAKIAWTDPSTTSLTWRDAKSTSALVGMLEDWIDDHVDLPRNPTPPRVLWTSSAHIRSMSGLAEVRDGGRRRGLYDASNSIIWLALPWNKRDPRDVSTLLHELIHHRQVLITYWPCAGAQELMAYRAQDAWLAALGLSAKVNWIEVVLLAGCTPRDIHPD